jgi:hypothetical protein
MPNRSSAALTRVRSGLSRPARTRGKDGRLKNPSVRIDVQPSVSRIVETPRNVARTGT